MNNKNCSIDGGLLAAGQALVNQRQKLGLTPGDCAESLKITEGKLKALESGEKFKFTSEFFVRGYLKNYAKLVKITEEEILHLYHIKDQHSHAASSETEGPLNISKPSIWWLPYLVVMSIVVAWFFVSDYFYTDSDYQVESVAQSENRSLFGIDGLSTSSSVVESDAPSRVVNGSALSTLHFSYSSPFLSADERLLSLVLLTGKNNEVLPGNYILASKERSGQSAEGVVDAPSSGVAPDSTVIVNELTAVELVGESISNNKFSSLKKSQVVNGALDKPFVKTVVAKNLAAEFDVLYLSFSQECWVKVIDASSEVLVSSLRLKNTQLEVKGKAPFDIILGNVVGASMLFNGKPVALNSDNPSRTLHLTVGG